MNTIDYNIRALSDAMRCLAVDVLNTIENGNLEIRLILRQIKKAEMTTEQELRFNKLKKVHETWQQNLEEAATKLRDEIDLAKED